MEKDTALTVYRSSDEYEALVEECQAIITQRVKNFRLEKILMYGQLGERISDDSLFKKYGKGNLAFLQGVSEDVGISYSDICRAIQFYEKFEIVSPDSENWKKFKEGENISWNKIKIYYLPSGEKKECQHLTEKVVLWRCVMCKKLFTEKPDEKQGIKK